MAAARERVTLDERLGVADVIGLVRELPRRHHQRPRDAEHEDDGEQGGERCGHRAQPRGTGV